MGKVSRVREYLDVVRSTNDVISSIRMALDFEDSRHFNSSKQGIYGLRIKSTLDSSELKIVGSDNGPLAKLLFFRSCRCRRLS
jgi:hypothetical protein